MDILGIDIGGSGVKGAPVDSDTGQMRDERYRLETPQPATPEAVVETVARVARHFGWGGNTRRIGCGFPAAVKNGEVFTAANIDRTWIGVNAQTMIEEATGCPTRILNDADAAGLAEVRFGAGKDQKGVVLMCTLGTGIGTALFIDGILLPNTELGHIEIGGVDAELRASDGARQREDLGWKKWSKRVNTYLTTMENLFWPDLIIVGGGVSKSHEKFFPLLTLRTRIMPAQLLNQAGIVGAAMAAAEL
jgi:polyphosphate glucokinase